MSSRRATAVQKYRWLIDGANSSDKGSVFYQARLAALIHCVRDGDAARGVSPFEALRMAARGGAEVMLMEEKLGVDCLTLSGHWDEKSFSPLL